MMDAEIRNSTGKNIDISQVVEFQDKMKHLEEEIYKVVVMQINFWKELNKTHSNARKLLFLAEDITKKNDSIKAFYISLCNLNSSHIRMLEFYGNFLNDILNDNLEGPKLLEK